jgi:lipopolysaccharide/colanic/teichoic acid biosynthesis glycosyltransferase
VKRRLDIFLAVAGLLFFLPIMLLIALLIKLDDGGPILFRQDRLGKYKQPFLIYKFRSMYDGKITRIGQWLRKSGLDELPQIVNILQGDMSLVGPRPLTYADIQRMGWDKRYYISRWHIKPGITGLAQLHAGRSAHHSWLYDKTYLKHESLLLDFKIIILTLFINVLGKRRVREWLFQRNNVSVNWKRWAILFSTRRHRPVPQTLDDHSHQPWSAALAKSLAIFQLGESGGGTVIQQAKRSPLHGIDPAYCKSVEWFVDEEHRHAEILACCVQALGGECIQHNWTAKLFVSGRRMLGLRFKVLVLLAAEVVGICYYKLLAMRLPAGQIRDLLDELASDEEAHLKFHCDFLRLYAQGILPGLVFSLLWRLVTYAAAIVVIIDHRQALQHMDIPLKLVWQRWMFLVDATEKQITTVKPNYQFLQQVNIDYPVDAI